MKNMIYFLKHMRNIFLPLISLFFITAKTASAQDLKVIYSPLNWNKEREMLSVEYLKKRHGIDQQTARIEPKMVVVHWTANNSYAETMNAFREPTLKGRPELVRSSALNVSSQYIIERDGSIFQLLPDTILARHTIGLNYMAIGIENIGSEKNPLTKQQLKANANLISFLKEKYDIEYVIGHHEYGLFRNSDLWKETDAEYFTHKIDPGAKFMKQLRKKLKKYDFKKMPN